MTLLTDIDKSNIIFTAIRDYKQGESDFFILITLAVFNTISNKKSQLDVIDTQILYEEISDCFDFFNAFIKEKNMELPEIPSEHYDITMYMINDVIDDIKGNNE